MQEQCFATRAQTFFHLKELLRVWAESSDARLQSQKLDRVLGSLCLVASDRNASDRLKYSKVGANLALANLRIWKATMWHSNSNTLASQLSHFPSLPFSRATLNELLDFFLHSLERGIKSLDCLSHFFNATAGVSHEVERHSQRCYVDAALQLHRQLLHEECGIGRPASRLPATAGQKACGR